MNASDAHRYARVAGVLLLVSILAGGFAESYVPSKLMVTNNVAETARRVAGFVALFRASFAVYLIEAMCDLSLTAILYFLLRPVSGPLSLIAAFVGVFSTATFAVAEVFYFAAALPVIDANVARSLTPDNRAAFSYLCLTLYGYVFGIFAVSYGIPVMLRGYLMFRSGYFPRALGAIVMLGGAGFIAKNFFAVLFPRYDSMLYVLPMMLAMVSLALWFLVKGIDYARWEEMEQRSESY
jgi:hypothetical protein